MGRTVFSDRIETGHPYEKIKEECFMQQVRNGFSWYSGDLGAALDGQKKQKDKEE